MNLYDRSLSLRVRLDEVTKGSGDHELLKRGRGVVGLLDESTAMLQRMGEFREAFELGPLPLEAKAVSRSARQLRAGLTKHQAAALQHQATTKFEEAVRLQVKMGNAWAKAKWKDRFERWQEVIGRGEAGGFFGDDKSRRRVRILAANLKVLAGMHPVADHEEIDSRLGNVGMAGWTAALNELGSSLTAEIAGLEQQQRAFDPEVAAVLQRVASDGMPLADLTPDLLEHLRAAGVIGDLVVTRA